MDAFAHCSGCFGGAEPSRELRRDCGCPLLPENERGAPKGLSGALADMPVCPGYLARSPLAASVARLHAWREGTDYRDLPALAVELADLLRTELNAVELERVRKMKAARG